MRSTRFIFLHKIGVHQLGPIWSTLRAPPLHSPGTLANHPGRVATPLPTVPAALGLPRV
jgi:hypothetical protein